MVFIPFSCKICINSSIYLKTVLSEKIDQMEQCIRPMNYAIHSNKRINHAFFNANQLYNQFIGQKYGCG